MGAATKPPLERVAERRRAVALAWHYREAEGLSIANIADRLGRAPATVKSYFYDPSDANKGPSRERGADVGGRELRRHLPTPASRGDTLCRHHFFCSRADLAALMLDRVTERRRAVQLARHNRDQEGLSIADICRRLGRAEATVKAYLYDPTGAKARAVKARYRGLCRGCRA